jgi:transposase InsO family protein
MGKKKQTKRLSNYPPEFRLRVLREVLEEKTPQSEVARIYGISAAAIYKWLKAFKRAGEGGLTPAKRGPGRPPSVPDARRIAVVEAKQQHPELGTQKIADLLRRFEGLGVSESTVRRILHEEGLMESRPPEVEKAEPLPRRFERAAPNQLWQSDIFTFLLRRHERLYVTIFMDDYSRFIVGQAVAHQQKAELVLEAFERGVASFGVPEEVLTDNGRQYTTWRGETAFEAELKRNGIHHIKSRPHHPQTLGKVERFWKTLWDEFLSRTVFSNFDDCVRRLGLFVDGYNFRRPHQGIEGLVPADRFFRAAPQVRAAIEATVAANVTQLALQQPLRKPFYLAGQLGNQSVSIAAEGGRLRVQMGDEQPQTIHLPEQTNEVSASNRVDNRQTEAEAPQPPAPDAEVAQGGGRGAGGGGAAPVPPGAGGAEWRAAGDGRHRVNGRFAPAVLPTGGAGAEGDAAGAGARRGDVGGAGRVPRYPIGGGAGAGETAGDGEAARGAAPLPDAQAGEAGPGDGGSGRAAEEVHAALDESWARVFNEWADEDGDSRGHHFNPDADFRAAAVNWERKLVGATAPGGINDSQPQPLREGAGADPGGPAAVRGGAEEPLGPADGDGSGGVGGPVAAALPDAAAPWPEWLARSPGGPTPGPAGDAGDGEGAAGRGGGPAEGEPAAGEAGELHGADDGAGHGVDAQGAQVLGAADGRPPGGGTSGQ